jgi:predicted dehydrogenase
VRVGVIGTGFGAAVHVPAFASLPGVEVVGLAGADPERTATVARQAGVPAYTGWAALLEDPAVTAVSVATPPALHHTVVMAALRRGKHVLCEKPFGTTPKQAAELAAAAAEAGVVHAVDFLFRMAPERRRLKTLLAEGALGALRRVEVAWTLAGRAGRDPRWCWQVDPAAGGGTLLAFGSHVVDYLAWLLGPLRAVSAQLSVRRPIRHAATGATSAEDTVDALALLGDGTPVAVGISTVTPGGRGHWLSVYGERGALVVGNPNLEDVVTGTRLYRAGPEGNALEPVEVAALPAAGDGRLTLFRELAGAFVAAIQSGRASDDLPTFRDGWRAQVVLDALRRSHESRTWMDVPA